MNNGQILFGAMNARSNSEKDSGHFDVSDPNNLARIGKRICPALLEPRTNVNYSMELNFCGWSSWPRPTVYDTDYKANASSNTMGSLGRGEKVLVIRRRLKTKAVRRNGPPGRFHALAGPVVGEATLYWTAMHRHLIFCGWCPGSRRFAATVNCAM